MTYAFSLDVPEDLVAPHRVRKVAAFEGNLGGYGRPNAPRALVLHTPEEDADGVEVVSGPTGAGEYALLRGQ